MDIAQILCIRIGFQLALVNKYYENWKMIHQENAQQGVAGYPPQGVGSPER